MRMKLICLSTLMMGILAYNMRQHLSNCSHKRIRLSDLLLCIMTNPKPMRKRARDKNKSIKQIRIMANPIKSSTMRSTNRILMSQQTEQ